jgi:hypothetical protein
MTDTKLTNKPIYKTKCVIWRNWTYDGILTEAEAAQKQLEAGYHPAGYGFYAFNVKDGKTTWQCSMSCD